MSQTEVTIVTSWDSMPPEVYANGEIFSTRVLAAQHRKANEMVEELEEMLRLAKKDTSKVVGVLTAMLSDDFGGDLDKIVTEANKELTRLNRA